MRDAPGVGLESLICTEIQRGDEARELPIVADRDRHVTIGRREHLVRHDVGVGIAVAHRLFTGGNQVAEHVDQARNPNLHQRHVDPRATHVVDSRSLPEPARAPLGREQPGKRAHRHLQARQQVEQRHPDLHWRT